jgi:DNA-binding beta-propeller fold protein YncE
MQRQVTVFWVGCLMAAGLQLRGQPIPANSFFNWETAPIHPVALSPAGRTLAVCNLPDNRVELFKVASGLLTAAGSIPVGLDPVSLRFASEDELWVVNHISDSVSIVTVSGLRVVATLQTLNEPADIVFAGSPRRAFVSCSEANTVQVFDPVTRSLTGTVAIDAEEPKAMAVSPDGTMVYAAIFESGNGSTIIAPPLTQLENFPAGNPVNLATGPNRGKSPPPNAGSHFFPAINPAIPATNAPPQGGMIVKKKSRGRWLDDNDGDWSEFVSGSKAFFTGRRPGWDLPDRDVAVIDAETLQVSYIAGLMNICMDLSINPSTGQISVIGTDALNEMRFEPVLQGVFLRVNLALVDPKTSDRQIKDLNSHLTYRAPIVPRTERMKSIGDPRGIVWNAWGTRGYVTGMGSNNLLVIDSNGDRVGPPLGLEEGPTGLVVDDRNSRLYVLNRFQASVSIVDTVNTKVIQTVRFFDPTPKAIKAGRKHFYDTQKTSGLGHVSCASCHVDGRMDRLAWDLGNPAGEMKNIRLATHNFARFPPAVTNHFHPMKGPMVTQTLQDIIGHEPFHWRGDKDGLEEFNAAFTGLQGAEAELTRVEMQEFEDFLATIGFSPNPYREFDNSLSTNLALTGHFALGHGALPPGAPLPNGNARAGLTLFRDTGEKGCIVCHTLPSGLGADRRFNGNQWLAIPAGPKGQHHVAMIALNRSAQLPFKVQHLRNLYEKAGMTALQLESAAGFGFLHDGSVDSLARFLQDGFDFRPDQEIADLIAFLISLTGSDLPAGSATDESRAPGVSSLDVPAAVGKQLTLANSRTVSVLNEMVALTDKSTSRVDLVVKGSKDGIPRGWVYDRSSKQFLSDHSGELISVNSLRALATTGNEFTFTLVPGGSGRRIGIDRDQDGFLDGNELESGSNPASASSVPGNNAPELKPIFDVTVLEQSPIRFKVEAMDAEARPLAFSLASGAPSGATIHPVSGEFAWTPIRDQRPGVYTVTIKVSDDGSPPLSSQLSFRVFVADPSFALNVSLADSNVELGWDSGPGKIYRVQFKNHLEDLFWTTLGDDITATSTRHILRDRRLPAGQGRYYRLQIIE